MPVIPALAFNWFLSSELYRQNILSIFFPKNFDLDLAG